MPRRPGYRRAKKEMDTYVCAALEEQRRVAWTLGEAESRNGLGGLVVVGDEEVVEALVTDGLHEPFSVCSTMSVSF